MTEGVPAGGHHETDVVIIGAGPVGLFAIFECGMLRMRCHVVDALPMIGGQCAALYPEKPIYDVPGFPTIDAQDLVGNLVEQAAPFAPWYHLNQQVTGLETLDDGRWQVTTEAGTTVTARAIIIAAGVGAFGPNRPPLDGIETYEGQAVHYMIARKDQFRGQRLVIAGGGDSALDWAIALADIAADIKVVHRRAKFRAAPESVARMNALADAGKLEIVTPYQLDALDGDGERLAAVIVKTLDGEERRLEADHLLAFFGLSMNLGPIADWGLDLAKGSVKTDPSTSATNLPGVFAVGDVASYDRKLKLILTGFAEAASAAHAIHPLVHPGEALHFEYSTTKGVPGLAT